MPVEERVFDVRRARAPATRYDRRLDRELCRADAARAVEIFAELRAADASLAGWVNFPLLNETGLAGDVGLKPFSTPPRKTEFASRLPAVARILDGFAGEGLKILFARVAVLGQRDALRPHVDTYPNTRLLIALSEQGDDFRHLYDNACFAMRVGEVWGGDGATCHGAANVGFSGHRVLLLLDVVPDAGAPGWLHARWRLPPETAIARPKLSPAMQRRLFDSARMLALQDGPERAERELLLLPFEYAMRADFVYRELVLFGRWMARCGPSRQRGYWRERVGALVRHSLPFEVAVPRVARR
jgi:hypothetical protein